MPFSELASILFRLKITSITKDAINKGITNYFIKTSHTLTSFEKNNLTNEILICLGDEMESIMDMVKSMFLDNQND